MNRPKIACCNFISDVDELKRFAIDNGFEGVDWSFTRESFPQALVQESQLVEDISRLKPLEIRYHCAFNKVDIGDEDDAEARRAMKMFRRVSRVVSKLGGSFLTIHVGLGRDNTNHLLWNRMIENLAQLVLFANTLDVHICLENLAWGWTSRPHLFEKIIRRSGAWATLDIGHARVSPYITSHHYDLEDFVVPHKERFLNAHVYHEEDHDTHIPPDCIADIEDRLHLLTELPLCNWWVLELREEKALLKTRDIVRAYLRRQWEGVARGPGSR